MAIYKLQPFVDRIAGSRGAATFQKAGTNFIIRKRNVIVQKRTNSQSIVKSRLAVVAQNWRTLSPAQQATWVAQQPNYTRLDSLGNPYQILGNALQNLTNINTVILDEPFVDTGSNPVVYPVRVIEFMRVNVDIQRLRMRLTDFIPPEDFDIPAGFSAKVYFSAAIPNQSNPPTLASLSLVTTLSEGINTAIVNFWNDYVKVFPPLIVTDTLVVYGAMKLTSLTNFVDGELISSPSTPLEP